MTSKGWRYNKRWVPRDFPSFYSAIVEKYLPYKNRANSDLATCLENALAKAIIQKETATILDSYLRQKRKRK